LGSGKVLTERAESRRSLGSVRMLESDVKTRWSGATRARPGSTRYRVRRKTDANPLPVPPTWVGVAARTRSGALAFLRSREGGVVRATVCA